jgi:hypothetical protein
MSDVIRFECRICKKVTNQLERIVTDNLPPNVKVLECTRCGAMGVCLLDEGKLGLEIIVPNG